MIVNSSRGGGSKDTWVLADDDENETSEPALPVGILAPGAARSAAGSWTGQSQQQQQDAARGSRRFRRRLMLARIAHELFWLGRNVSRAEHTARLIDGVFHADLQGPTTIPLA
jgi:hypothetical protein